MLLGYPENSKLPLPCEYMMDPFSTYSHIEKHISFFSTLFPVDIPGPGNNGRTLLFGHVTP
jgi:hypothetical protein